MTDTPTAPAGGNAANVLNAANAEGMPAFVTTKRSRLHTIIYGLVGLILGAIAIMKLAMGPLLPGCDANRTEQVLTRMFKNTTTTFQSLYAATTLAKSDDLITCTSSVNTTEGTARIDYKIHSHETDKFRVEITGVQPQ